MRITSNLWGMAAGEVEALQCVNGLDADRDAEIKLVSIKEGDMEKGPGKSVRIVTVKALREKENKI